MTSKSSQSVSNLTAQELLQRAADMVPVLKGRATHTEEIRRIPTETVQDILASGLHRIAVPRRFGGIDVGYSLMLDVGAELGRGCGATAWCYSLWAAHAWLIGYCHPVFARGRCIRALLRTRIAQHADHPGHALLHVESRGLLPVAPRGPSLRMPPPAPITMPLLIVTSENVTFASMT